MKNIVILGSTGSIGISTLAIIRRFPKDFRVVGLSTNANIGLLAGQVKEFHPEYVCVGQAAGAAQMASRLKGRVRVLSGQEGLVELVAQKKVDEVVVAISGSGALRALVAAITHRKQIVLANKESLVMAGPLVMRLAAEHKVAIKPVDSEQSAIWQCLNGQDARRLKHIYLTASGGPFRGRSRAQLARITVADALSHPRWKMGRKVTVDSATLMNKGLELFEVMYLFGVGPDQVKVLVHPQAIVHSMVEFVDGVIMAQLSATDMRIPIQYALTYPQRWAQDDMPQVDFVKQGSLTFEKPDLKRFVCLQLAYEAARAGGTMPSVLNAANEVCVEAFLAGRLDFLGIPGVVAKVMRRHHTCARYDLEDVYSADAWAKQEASALIGTRTVRSLR